MCVLASSREETRLQSQQAKLCAQESQVESHSYDNHSSAVVGH